MLIGATQKLRLPPLPALDSGIPGILSYIKELEPVLLAYSSSLVASTNGMLGVRGLSSTGVISQNFVQRVLVSNVTTGMWTFSNIEPDTSYLLLISSNYGASTLITQIQRATTNALFTCITGLSGMALDVCLLR